MDLTTQIIILAVLLLLSGFFSGIETALISIDKLKVNSLLKQKKKGAETLHRLKQKPRRLIITLLIGNNLANIAAAAFATVVFTDLFGSSGVGIATGVMTFLVLVFGEITPKTFANQNKVAISLFFGRTVEILSYIFFPLVIIFEGISGLMLMVVGSKQEAELTAEELHTIVTMGEKEGILDREAALMMKNVLKFENTNTRQVMTPKMRMEVIDGKKKLKDVLNHVVKTPYSKYPVYLEKEDNIIGILDVDDVLRYVKNNRLNASVKNVAQKPFFVPEVKKVDDLLAEFEKKKTQIAVVVNEYGDVTGVVTMEDVLEEIVGDIFDKSNRTSVYIKRVNANLIRVDARATIEKLNRVLHLGLKAGHFDTIAGFIEHKLQRIPKKGEKIKLRKVMIEIDKVTQKGISSVKIIGA